MHVRFDIDANGVRLHLYLNLASGTGLLRTQHAFPFRADELAVYSIVRTRILPFNFCPRLSRRHRHKSVLAFGNGLLDASLWDFGDFGDFAGVFLALDCCRSFGGFR